MTVGSQSVAVKLQVVPAAGQSELTLASLNDTRASLPRKVQSDTALLRARHKQLHGAVCSVVGCLAASTLDRNL